MSIEPQAPAPAASPGGGSALAYAPLVAAVLSVPWFLMMIVPLITAGGRTTQGANMRVLAVLAMLPAMAGILAGAVALARRQARSAAQRVWLLVGGVACGAIVYAFAGDVLR